jgi:phenylpropionate dioxygenase-like ring-hydroxylating dioxygenase large terminal subunit
VDNSKPAALAQTGGASQASPVRADFVPKSDYISREVLAREKEKLFPKVWQIVCRLEEIPNVGDFFTYDIGEDSILVVRSAADKVQAHFNVCQHRGRQLKEGCGNTGASIQCRYHGWRWNLDGSLARVKSREDWQGCPDMDDASLALKPVQADTWAGWVWINMDPDAESLCDYLSPVPKYLDGFLFEEMRFNWYRTIILPCNWKTVLDAFNEGYHTEATHPQMSKYGLSEFPTKAFGKHAMFYTGDNAADDPSAPMSSTGAVPDSVDARKFQLDYVQEMNDTLGAMYTDKAVAAAKRMYETLPPTATPGEVGATFMQLHREITEQAGARWPSEMTPEQMMKAGVDWHVFPNTVLLPTIDGALWYRARPNGDDPNSCIYDVWSLGRYKAGDEPPLKREFFATPAEFEGQCFFLEQDLTNLRLVQKGMRSRGFKGSRTSPVQEITVSNFHKTLHQYIDSQD